MTVKSTRDKPAAVRSAQPAGFETDPDDVTPNALLERFKGRGILSIALFSIIVHVVVLVGASVPFLMKTFRGTDTSKMSDKERLDVAIREATDSLRDIARAHGLNPQDLSNQFGGSAPRPAKAQPEAPKPDVPKTATPTVEPEKPKSTLEKELEVKAQGPTEPKLDPEKDDLFK